MKDRNLVYLWESYNLQASKNGLISLVSGRPGQEVYQFSIKQLKKSFLQTVKFEIDKIVDYSPVDGSLELKNALIQKYESEGIKIKAKNILITSGSQQALDLFFHAVLEPKDKVLIAKENYIGLQKSLINCQAQIITLNKTISNTSLDEFEQILKKTKINVFYLAPDFANPTGETLTLKKRREIILLAKKYHFVILEDQVYRDLVYEEKNQLPSLRKLNYQVNMAGSVSKILVPGLRIGWLIVDNQNIKEVYAQKRAHDLHTPFLNQRVISRLIENQKYLEKHLVYIRNYYQKKMEILLSSLKKYMPQGFSWNKPQGGFFVWVEGPKKIDSRILFKKALKNGVAIMPGFIFYLQKPKYNNFRLSVSNISKNQIAEGIKKLAEAIKEFI